MGRLHDYADSESRVNVRGQNSIYSRRNVSCPRPQALLLSVTTRVVSIIDLPCRVFGGSREKRIISTVQHAQRSLEW